jgi:hypothetical protein
MTISGTTCSHKQGLVRESRRDSSSDVADKMSRIQVFQVKLRSRIIVLKLLPLLLNVTTPKTRILNISAVEIPGLV